jgi:2,4-dienoyl-CoA reductase-like NADH-dependent reductase (Old Yellow Enzyme family)
VPGARFGQAEVNGFAPAGPSPRTDANCGEHKRLSSEILFTPFACRKLKMPNRVAMAPMTRGKSPGGVPTDAVAEYYARRALGGVGLIITEGTGVARPVALNNPNYPRFHGEDALAGWANVEKAVHGAGGRIAPQLWHMGLVRSRDKSWTPPGAYDSPSGFTRPHNQIMEGMSEAEVADTIDAFGRGAESARKLGFDAVEIHGAHGYLVDQFFWGELNKRSDRWGGPTIAERARFGAEVVRAVRKGAGEDLPVIIRISQWKLHEYTAKNALTPAELETWLTPLVEAGADILHCSQRRIWEHEFEGSDLNFAGWAKKVTGAATMSVGSVGLSSEFIGAYRGEASKSAPLTDVTHRLERGDFDLVAVGRALLQDPYWLKKVQEARSDELMDFDAAALETLS